MIYKIAGITTYLLVLVGIGVVAARRMDDIEEYFAAGKKLSFIPVAFSARASGESAWLLLGLTGMGAALGVKAFWVVLGEVLGVAGAWLLMSRRFKRLTDRYDSITVPDYLESRFRDDTQILRAVAAAALTIFVTIYVSAQIDATGKAFETFLGLNYYTGAVLGFTVVMIYIGFGGFLAVAWSDVFQGLMMFLGLVVLPIVGLFWVGSIGELTAGLSQIDPDLLSINGGMGWTAVSIAEILSLGLIGLGFLGSPQVFVRFIALRDEREIKIGATVAILWTLLADTGAVLTGMVGRYLLTEPGVELTKVLGESGEDVLPILVGELMPALLVGLYIAVVLAAIMSTIDSLLVVAGSAAVRDFYQKILHPEISNDELVAMSRTVTVGLALAGLAIALSVAVLSPNRTVFWFVIFGYSGIASTFCPTIILSLFWKRITTWGALAAMVFGFAGVPIFKFAAPHLPVVGDFFGALGELPAAFALSFLAGITVSLLDTDGQRELADVDLAAEAP